MTRTRRSKRRPSGSTIIGVPPFTESRKATMGISHRLLNQLRMRVLVYDLSMTQANRDQLIVAARAVARDWDQARPALVQRNSDSRRELMKRRLEAGLCSRCGKRPHR